jgi:hypothetical protein
MNGEEGTICKVHTPCHFFHRKHMYIHSNAMTGACIVLDVSQ